MIIKGTIMHTILLILLLNKTEWLILFIDFWNSSVLITPLRSVGYSESMPVSKHSSKKVTIKNMLNRRIDTYYYQAVYKLTLDVGKNRSYLIFILTKI